MKFIAKSAILSLITLCSVQLASAQLNPETHSVGARFGSATGLTYRYALNEVNALEGILSVQSNSKYSRFRLTGLYEFHKPITDDFNWYWGFGGSIGSYTRKSYSLSTQDGSRVDYPKDSEFALSADGIIGAEYNIPTTALGVSIDYKPSIYLISPNKWNFNNFALSLRYNF